MKRLEALEGLRGYAAFLVFLVHSGGVAIAHLTGMDADRVSIFAMPPGIAAMVFLFRSHYGVDLFFVLSGLLMADIAARRWPGTGEFLKRRALRIYPAYLVSVAIAVAAIAWVFERRVHYSDLAANLVFLQGFTGLGFAAVNPVTWSLTYEAAFYALIPFIALAWSRRESPSRVHARWYLAAAFVLIIVIAAMLPGARAIYLAYFALFVPGLAIGALAPEDRARVAAGVPTWLAVAAWIGFTLAMKLELVSNTRPAYFAASALACGLLVLKCCDPQSLVARIFSTRPALALGRISYSFFLVHYVVVHVIGHYLHPDADAASRAMFLAGLFIGGFVLSVGAAWALFQAAERFYFVRTR